MLRAWPAHDGGDQLRACGIRFTLERLTVTKRNKVFWSKMIFDAARLSATVPVVIGLRMAKLARGGASAKRESKRMLDEKIKAALEANADAVQNIALGKAGRVPGRTLALYQKKVGNNLRRLLKKKRTSSI
jgi:hypothetical protein